MSITAQEIMEASIDQFKPDFVYSCGEREIREYLKEYNLVEDYELSGMTYHDYIITCQLDVFCSEYINEFNDFMDDL
jgi:hypothetical protein